MKRKGIAYTLAAVLIVLVFIVGVLWVAFSAALNIYSGLFIGQYPYGVFDPNLLLLFNFSVAWLPYIILLSLVVFVIIAAQRQKRSDVY